MRSFFCEACLGAVSFEDHTCRRCGHSLGYDPDHAAIRVLHETAPGTYRIGSDPQPRWRCLNAAWGCNWIVPSPMTTWCRSCRLTRGRPHESDPRATARWMEVEQGKRRVIHQLDSLGLTIRSRSEHPGDGLAFDLVHVPGASCVTGHMDGVITIDVTEADAVHRESVRQQLAEPFRTMVGHLRHELGHYYWDQLIRQTEFLVPFRVLFGDERQDYAAALDDHYQGERQSWSQNHISAYAAVHPHEDWAESFAHFLHIQDAWETAREHGFIVADGDDEREDDGRGDRGARSHGLHPRPRAMIDSWLQVAAGINDLASGLGAEPLYPFAPSRPALDKIVFVHTAISRRIAAGSPSGRDPAHPPA